MKIKTKTTTTLLDTLLKEAGYATSSKAREVIKNGAVWVNDEVVKIPSTVVETGSNIEIDPLRSKREADHAKYVFKVIFEDDYLIAVAKPPKMKIEKGVEGKPSFKDIVLQAMQKEKNLVTQLFALNYVETNATGIVIFAKNQKTAKALEAKTALKKTWIALVEGKLSQESGDLTYPLIKQKTGKVLAIERATKLSEEALTHFKVRKVTGNFSIVEVTAEDPKLKQFQAHFQLFGHPIAGNKKYGSTQAFSSRSGLHLEKISFTHPVSGKVINLQSNLPQTFTRAGRYL
ncbi:MAG: S4 domain-containing protein [Bacteroidota bacterium]